MDILQTVSIRAFYKRSPFGAPDYIPTTDTPHRTPVLERLGKCIGLGVTPYQFGSGTFF
jgi:hypothetical protein